MHPTIAKAQLTSQPQSSLSSFTERGDQSEPEHRRKLFADPLGPPSDSGLQGPTGLWIKDSVLQSIDPD